jgi:hypothetical protein
MLPHDLANVDLVSVAITGDMIYLMFVQYDDTS